MGRIRLGLSHLALAIMLSFASCSRDDADSLDNFWMSIATVDSLSPHTYSLVLDDGLKLWPAVSNDNSFRPRSNQRAFVNYTILSDKQDGFDHYIRVNYISSILTKKAIDLTAENADSIGNDPVEIKSIWSSGGFLNIEFIFRTSGQNLHAINLVNNTTTEHPHQDGKIYLEFRHNAFDDPQTVQRNSFVCFNLKPFQVPGKDSVELVIKTTEFYGSAEYEVTYNYNMSRSSSSRANPYPITQDMFYENKFSF